MLKIRQVWTHLPSWLLVGLAGALVVFGLGHRYRHTLAGQVLGYEPGVWCLQQPEAKGAGTCARVRWVSPQPDSLEVQKATSVTGCSLW